MGQRPEGPAPVLLAGLPVLLRHVAPDVEKAPGLFAEQVLRDQLLVHVGGPKDEAAGHVGVRGLAVQRPEAPGVFALAIGPADERPRSSPFLVAGLAVDRVGDERPEQRGVVQLRRPTQREQRQEGAVGGRVLRADPGDLAQSEGPEEKALLVAGNHLGQVGDAIGPGQHGAGFRAVQGPELPAQGPAVAPMEEREQPVVRDDVALPRLHPDGQGDETHLVPEQPVLQRAVEGNQGVVALRRIGRLLSEIERKEGEPLRVAPVGVVSAAPAQHLQDLPTVLGSVAVVGNQRVQELDLGPLDLRFAAEGDEGVQAPTGQARRGLGPEQRPGGFGPMSRSERQAELVGKGPRFHRGFRAEAHRGGAHREQWHQALE